MLANYKRALYLFIAFYLSYCKILEGIKSNPTIKCQVRTMLHDHCSKVWRDEAIANKRVVGANIYKVEKGFLWQRLNFIRINQSHYVLSHHALPINIGLFFIVMERDMLSAIKIEFYSKCTYKIQKLTCFKYPN